MPRVSWHEDEAFWQDTEDFLFHRRRWEATPAEVDQASALLSLVPGARVLDLCCGPGRHALELARRGFRVTGVDRTERYLERARRRASSEGLNVEWVQDDMRSFQRTAAFDAALLMFTSLGYFEDPAEDLQVLKNLRASLANGGRLLIDVQGKEALARVFRERDWDELDGKLLLEEREILEDWARIHSRWIIIDGTKRREHTLTLRLYSGSELRTALGAAGFSEVRLYGTLDGAPYDQNARRLIAVAA